MTADEVKNALKVYENLEKKAEEILDAEGNIVNDGLSGLEMDSRDKMVDIAYWTRCRGESFVDAKRVPIEWFSASYEELKNLWQKKREADRRAMVMAERLAEKRRENLKKTAAERKRKKELAELKRLKEKYPDA